MNNPNYCSSTYLNFLGLCNTPDEYVLQFRWIFNYCKCMLEFVNLFFQLLNVIIEDSLLIFHLFIIDYRVHYL